MTTLGRKMPRKTPPKSAAARVLPKRRFVESEPIRIVPLHTPKPMFTAGALPQAAQADVFDGQPRAAPPQANLSYRGGPLLQKAAVFTIFWGAQWQSSATAQPLMAKLNQFFSDIVASPLIDQLAEYNAPGKAIGHGSFIGTRIVTALAPVGSVTDSEVRGALTAWIKAKVVPRNTRNTLYFIFLEPGIVSIMGGSKSCQNYCGYHDRAGSVYYAVMPYPSCSGCLGGLAAFDALTATSSHELCEAITDPVPGKGWYDDRNGEIGDICAWNFKKVAGYTVQLEWSNAKGKCA